MKTDFRKILSGYKKRRLTSSERISAAVLVPLFQQDNDWHIVFIKRTYLVSNHKGQIAFPGGARDETDADLKATALRESREEIGLVPEDAAIIGELDDEFTTTSNYIMTPFVGIIPYPYVFTPNRFEVDTILTVPLSVLLDENNLSSDTEMLDSRPLPSYSYRYGDTIIWGATARILHKFIELIKPAL